MPLPAVIPPGEQVATADQRLVTYGVPWSHFEAQLALRGEAPVPRMAYLEGTLERGGRHAALADGLAEGPAAVGRQIEAALEGVGLARRNPP